MLEYKNGGKIRVVTVKIGGITLDDNNSKAIKRFDSESIKEKIC